jgi:hypothetical protein
MSSLRAFDLARLIPIRQPDLCLSVKAARDLWLVSWGALAIWSGLVTQIKDNILFAAYGGLAPDS